jgi:cyclopropane fatty-acyl-phospholipid synthase-like methyltransferase
VVPIALHDLTTGPYRMPVDLVISIEVAEHIASEYVDHFLDTVANGRVICMTAALPNQDGYHHVNCHPPEYWIGKIAKRGYILSHENEIYRQICATDIGPKHFITSGLILLKA